MDPGDGIGIHHDPPLTHIAISVPKRNSSPLYRNIRIIIGIKGRTRLRYNPFNQLIFRSFIQNGHNLHFPPVI